MAYRSIIYELENGDFVVNAAYPQGTYLSLTSDGSARAPSAFTGRYKSHTQQHTYTTHTYTTRHIHNTYIHHNTHTQILSIYHSTPPTPPLPQHFTPITISPFLTLLFPPSCVTHCLARCLARCLAPCFAPAISTSMYYIVVTITTVGYGDIVPTR